MTFGTDKNHKVMLWCDQPPVCTVTAYAVYRAEVT